ncbi:MAG: hypothetical protein LBM99_02110, partial [Bacillales bacterium]|nr:hypothetical protein [Bacillales bacterium]
MKVIETAKQILKKEIALKDVNDIAVFFYLVIRDLKQTYINRIYQLKHYLYYQVDEVITVFENIKDSEKLKENRLEAYLIYLDICDGRTMKLLMD